MEKETEMKKIIVLSVAVLLIGIGVWAKEKYTQGPAAELHGRFVQVAYEDTNQPFKDNKAGTATQFSVWQDREAKLEIICVIPEGAQAESCFISRKLEAGTP